LSGSTLALITVPFFAGAIGYVTNWTGVLMLFYPGARERPAFRSGVQPHPERRDA
jgi:hypothetical protein